MGMRNLLLWKRYLIQSEPLLVHPIAVIEETGLHESVSLDWIVERVQNFCQVVGLSCEGLEDQMLALFTAIEASRKQIGSASSSSLFSKSVNRGKCESNRLACSIKYDMKGGNSSRGIGKGRGNIGNL